MAFHSSLKNKLKDYFSSIKFSDLLLNFCIWFIGIIVGLIPFIFKFIISHDGIIAAKDFWERFEIPFAFISSAIVLCVEMIINCKLHNDTVKKYIIWLVFSVMLEIAIYMFICFLDVSKKEYILTNLSGGISLWIINIGISALIFVRSIILIVCQPVSNEIQQTDTSKNSNSILVTISNKNYKKDV